MFDAFWCCDYHNVLTNMTPRYGYLEGAETAIELYVQVILIMFVCVFRPMSMST